MFKTIPSALCALAVTLCAGTILIGCTNPVLAPFDTALNQTLIPYTEARMSTDTGLSDSRREAMTLEIKALRRLMDEAQGRETTTDSEVSNG